MIKPTPLLKTIIQHQNDEPQTSQHLSLPIDPKPKQLRLSGRFKKIIVDLDKSIASHNQDIEKQNHTLSKVDRKDTRESQREPTDFILKNQQPINVGNNQPISSIIEKSQNDPFLRRKLKAVVDNDLKSLKRLNDQKNKPANCSSAKNFSLFFSAKLPSTQKTNAIDDQMSRLPKDITKILDLPISRLTSSCNLKKISSQTNLILGSNENSIHIDALDEKNQEDTDTTASFTTLRRESYKKKVECLGVLRLFHDKESEIRKK